MCLQRSSEVQFQTCDIGHFRYPNGDAKETVGFESLDFSKRSKIEV